MNLGKCNRCGKSVYELEAARYGPPGKEQVVHKACFVCQNPGCTWKLDARSYFYYEGKTYCKGRSLKAHNAMTGASNDARAKGTFETTMELKQQTEVPKQDLVRANIVSPRGEKNAQNFF